MNNKNTGGYIVLAIVGLLLVLSGVMLIILYSEPEGIMRALPFALIGIGLGAIGGSLGGILSIRAMKRNPKLAIQMEIEKSDERNVAISNKAKAKTFDFTWLLFAALIIFLAVMQIELFIVLVAIGAFVVKIFVFIFLLNKYHKEM